MHQVVVEWGLRLMKNKKWYIVVEYWVSNNEKDFWINNWKKLTSNKDYDHSKVMTHIEEIEPDGDWQRIPKNQFTISSKDGWFKFTGNLEQCLDFIEKINDAECWEDWEWSNRKYGDIYVEEDEG